MSDYDPGQGMPPPGQGQGGQDYPGAPPPSHQPPPPRPAEAPSQVRLAVNLSFVLVALALIGVILGFAQRDAAIEAARNANTGGLTDAQIQAAVTATLTFFAIFAVILSAVFVWLAFMARKGTNWARIVMTVLLVIWALLTLVGIGGTAPAITKVVSVLELILQVAILVLLWQRPSTEFFRASSAPRY